jgi:GH15 family glucan-1,4-alpha-glucosidase
VFGEQATANRYAAAASEIKAAALTHLWDAEANRFRRGLCVDAGGELQPDLAIDSSLYGVFYFGMLPADDPRVVSTMETIRRRLWSKTAVGGIARYENDYFHQVSHDIQDVPGNPWFICTLWLAQWHIARARRITDLAPARELLEWAAQYAAPSGVMAEQLNPYSGDPMSVAPLTWTHGTFAAAALEYAQKYTQLAHTPTTRHVPPEAGEWMMGLG